MARNADDLAKRIKPLFEDNFIRFGELGAAVSIWQGGNSVLELQGGFRDAQRESPWTSETIVLFWSATKGLGSACLLHEFLRQALPRFTEMELALGEQAEKELAAKAKAKKES